MQDRHRGFTDEFRAHMGQHGAWPPEKAVYAWFNQKQKRGIEKCYNALKYGAAAGDRFVTGFVHMMLDQASPSDPFRWSRNVMLDFLRERGIHTLTQVAPDLILEHICTPATLQPPSRDARIDFLLLGLRVIGHFYSNLSERVVDDFVQRCDDRNADVEEAIRWMYMRIGQSIGMKGTKLSDPAAEALAVEHLHTPLSHYLANAQEWHTFNPWTVVFARDARVPAGVSIVIPVTASAYDLVLQGKLATYQLNREHLTVPSTHLVLECSAENPHPSGPPNFNPTRALLMCLTLQTAALARCQEGNDDTCIRVLSFDSTPLNRRRLLNNGFQATGRTMARTGFPLLERRIPLHSWKPVHFLTAAMLRHFGALCDRAPLT